MSKRPSFLHRRTAVNTCQVAGLLDDGRVLGGHEGDALEPKWVLRNQLFGGFHVAFKWHQVHFFTLITVPATWDAFHLVMCLCR
jgi:hypothetical protein